MKRVMIVGCGGAGKSTLSAQLAERTGLPEVSLDAHFWTPDWVEEDRAVWEAKVAELVADPEWIMDGNYGSTMELRLKHADTVILIDRAPVLCLWRLIRRRWMWRGRVRPGLPEGCIERLDTVFIHYVVTWRIARLPGVLTRLEAARARGVTVHILRSDGEVRTFLNAMPLRQDGESAD